MTPLVLGAVNVKCYLNANIRDAIAVIQPQKLGKHT